MSTESLPGLTVERLHDNRIVVFTVHDMSPGTVELWANNVIEVTESRQAKDIYYVHDASHVPFAMTPHFRRHSERVTAAHPNAKGFVGIVLRQSLLLTVTRIIIENLVRRSQPGITSRIFFDRAQAVIWLESCIASQRQSVSSPLI
jgi:hypothetical protein